VEEKIYREKTLNRIKSPDQLNEYIKIANPRIWLTLIAILMLVVGGIFWCIFAKLETKVDTVAVVENGRARCYINEEWHQYLNDSMYIEINGIRYVLGDHGTEIEKLEVDNPNDEMYLHMMNVSESGWYYTYDIETDALADGLYSGTVIVDSVNPISFVVNGK